MPIEKGIILAAGRATRLHPMTLAFGKPLLPIFDKPMIYYPLSTLILAGMREILIVTAPRDTLLFKTLLGDGRAFGVSVSYAEQPVAKGIADALLIGEKFIGGDACCLLLGDNFFHSPGMADIFQELQGNPVSGATIFCKEVENPSAYGVAEMAPDGKVKRLVEKPQTYISSHAVTGLYFYDGAACRLTKTLAPSPRGELEITDLNNKYLEQSALQAKHLPGDTFWRDLGTPETMLEAASFIQEKQNETGRKIGCPYTAAFMTGRIDARQLMQAVADMENPAYAQSLKDLPETSI